MPELTQDQKAKPAPALCPLCGDTLKHGKRFMTHFYTCPACPFAGVEYIEKADADNLADVLKNGKPCDHCDGTTTTEPGATSGGTYCQGCGESRKPAPPEPCDECRERGYDTPHPDCPTCPTA